MDIITLSGIMAVCRDNYKTKYKTFKKEFEERVKKIRDDYNPKSELLKEELQKAETKFNDDIQKLQIDVRGFAVKNINELRDEELQRVQQIDTNSMAKLSAVADLPLTASEISVLQARFAPNDEYWAMRKIANMAEKNGLNPSQFNNSSSLDTRLGVIGQLESQLSELMENYNGEVKYGTEVLLCDSVLLRAERVYTAGWNVEMEDEQVARRAFLQLKGKSMVEQGIALSNIFNSTTEETKRALFFEMANNSQIISEESIKWAGLYDEFEAYKNNEHDKYTEARKAIEQTLTANSKEDVGAYYQSNADNKFYTNMIEKAKENNIHINEYLSDMNNENNVVLVGE